MACAKIRRKYPFTITERRGKGGSVTVIRHTDGFRSLAVEGQCGTPAGLTDSPLLYGEITGIGYDLLNLFPDSLLQRRSAAIISYTLPSENARATKNGLRYSFTYILSGGSDTETAIGKLLPLIPKINQKIENCIEQVKCDGE